MRVRDVFYFWLPLLVSWLLMTSEGPVITALVSRRPDAIVQLAAVGIVIALSVAIESPIIQLLATATAVVKDQSSFEVVRRFTLHWMIALTAVHLLLAWTPVFDLVVRRAMAPPEDVARAVLGGMRIMVPWSAAIAWRRFLQGVLIRYGHPRAVAWGTALRLIASAGTALMLAFGSDLPGVAVGSWALVNGVIVEAIYVSFAARSSIRENSSATLAKPSLGYRGLWRFHLPLATTSMLALVVQPLIAATLARLEHPEVTLAAWPVVFHLTLWTRAPAFALPEAVVALSSRRESAPALRRFTLLLGAVTFVGMVSLVGTKGLELYLTALQALDETVAKAAYEGIVMLLPFPALSVLIAWLRGRLIVEGRTAAVNLGMIIHVAVAALTLAAALLFAERGLVWAAMSLTLAAAAETVLLYRRSARD
jgi:uncharacterized membrane protein (DUF485 family)